MQVRRGYISELGCDSASHPSPWTMWPLSILYMVTSVAVGRFGSPAFRDGRARSETDVDIYRLTTVIEGTD
jgi:hypothetical protein